MRHSLGQMLCAIALMAGVCSLPARADDESCVVVLRSGGVLHGSVSVEGERYVVSAPNRTIDVQSQQVLLVAPTMEAAYDQQRGQLPQDNNDSRLRLVEWCLRYELLTQAEQELADARRIDQHDPRLPLLDRRLAVAKKPKKYRSVYQTSIAVGDNKSQAELEELEAVAADLPRGAVERFTRKVQPLLVNGCTAAGCHESGGAQKFQLDRAVLHGLSNRRITLRNLTATLALVDRSSPDESELLKMARRSHGGHDRPALNARQASQLKQLTDWVDLLAGTPREPARFAEPLVANATAKQADASQPPPSIPSTFLDRDVQPASHAEAETPLRPKQKIKYGAELHKWQPKDEFDPEIFNRAQKARDALQNAGAKGG
ncbi:MAG: hypothetical protein AB7U97_18275 [Pirellulales bacterium]